MTQLVRKAVAAGAALILGAALFVAQVPAYAAGDTHSDWVPPGQVDKTGVDVSRVAVGGTVTGVSAVPADLIDRATVGQYCAVRIASLVWTDHTLTVTTSGEGGVWCNAPISLSSSSALPYAWCYIDGVAVSGSGSGVVGSLGGTSDGGATYVYGGNVCAGGSSPAACFSWQKQEGDWSGHWDGFTSCDPSPAGAQLRIIVGCSDGSTVTATGASGAAIPPPACPSGSVVTSIVATSVTGSPVGTVTTHSTFPAECRGGTCLPWVQTASGVWCSVADPSCSWWVDSGAGSPLGCGWAPAGTSNPEMFASLLASDCEDAKTHGGFPDPRETPAPTPTPTATAGSTSTVKVEVNVTVTPVPPTSTNPPITGGCLSTVSGFNPAEWVYAPVRCLFLPSPGLGSSVMSHVAGSAAGAGGGLSAWVNLGSAMAGAIAVADDGRDCSTGPEVRLPIAGGVSFYPMDSCTSYGRRLAAVTKTGLSIGLVFFGIQACFNALAGGIGYGGGKS